MTKKQRKQDLLKILYDETVSALRSEKTSFFTHDHDISIGN